MTVTADSLEFQFPALKEAQGKLDAKRKELKDIFQDAWTEQGELDTSKIKGLSGDSHDKVDEIRKLNDEMNDLKGEVESLVEVAKAAGHALAHEEKGGLEVGDDERISFRSTKSIGELFVASQAFKGYQLGSGVGPAATLDIELKTLFQTTAGWDPEVTRTGRVELFATRPAPHVVDAIPQTTTMQAAIKYMEETTFTNNAAETSEGGLYGEAALVLTEKDSNVRKVGVWLPVTDEQFEDEPRSSDYVNNRLVFMLRQRLDSQALVGNGTAPNLRGTENVVGIQTQALGTDPIFDAVYKLFTKIRDDGFAEPSVFFIRPSKWQTVRLTRTADGIYILGNPGDEAPVRLWGVRGIETTAAPATKLLAGDYRNFSELASRRGVDVQVTNSHSTDFINGKLAMRADVRAALVHYRPKAFGEVSGL